MRLTIRITGLLVAVGLAACTSAPVDQATAAKIKSVTITKLYLSEYTYFGRDGEAAAKSLGTAAVGYAFGVFGIAAAEAARAKSEQPYRDAIKAAVSKEGVGFGDIVDARVGDLLKAKGIRATFIAPPPRTSEGFDYGNIDTNDNYVLELLPFAAGFTYGKEASTPSVDIRWRLLERYPGGRLIEIFRGSIYYSHYPLLGAKNSVQVPMDTAHRFPGHVTDLAKHGEAPSKAMRQIAENVATAIVEKAFAGGK